jgi:hypothetical protein
MKKLNFLHILPFLLALAFFGICVLCDSAIAQDAVPVLHSKRSQVSIQDGFRLKRNGWDITDADPDSYETAVPAGSSKTVKFISDEGQLTFRVEGGKTYAFNVVYAGKVHHTQIVGKTGPDTYDLKF